MHRAFLCSFAIITSTFAGNPHRIAATEWHTPAPTPAPAVIQAATPTDDIENPRFEACIRETLGILSRLSGQVSSSTTASLAEQTSAVATHDSMEAQVVAIGGVELLLAITQELKQPDSRGHAELFYSFYRGWFGLDWPTPQHIAAYNDYLRTPGLAISPTLKNNILSFNALVYNYLNTHIDYNPQSETYGRVKPRTPNTGTIIGITIGCTLAALAAGLGGYFWGQSRSKTERHPEAVDDLWSYWESQKGKQELAMQERLAHEHWKKSSLTNALAAWLEKKRKARRERVATPPASPALSVITESDEENHEGVDDEAGGESDPEEDQLEVDSDGDEDAALPVVPPAPEQAPAQPPNTPIEAPSPAQSLVVEDQPKEASDGDQATPSVPVSTPAPPEDSPTPTPAQEEPPPPSREEAAADLAAAQKVPLPLSPPPAATPTEPAPLPPPLQAAVLNSSALTPPPPQQSSSLAKKPPRGRTMSRRANSYQQRRMLPDHSPLGVPEK